MSIPRTEWTLEQLAARAVAGDRAALEDVCRALQAPMYRLALRMLGRVQDAEDAAQEILVVIATHLSQFRGESKLTTWAYTIATRHLLRARASRAEERAVPVSELAALIDGGLAATTPSSLPEGDVALLARDVQRTCSQAMLLTLSREERQAVVLVEMLGATAVRATPAPGLRAGRFPITVDATSRPDGLRFTIDSTDDGGTCTSVGVYFSDVMMPLQAMYTRGIAFLTSRVDARRELPAAAALAGHGFDLAAVATTVLDWSQAAEAWGEPATKLVVHRAPSPPR